MVLNILVNMLHYAKYSVMEPSGIITCALSYLRQKEKQQDNFIKQRIMWSNFSIVKTYHHHV